MSERDYDPSFAGLGDGTGPRVSILDVARDHAARQRYCGCPICECARSFDRLQARKAEAERQRALTERLMKEWH